MTMETRDNNVTWSGLEPGALHLVEIVAKECGKEGARTQVKVRTGKDLWMNRQAQKGEQRQACWLLGISILFSPQERLACFERP